MPFLILALPSRTCVKGLPPLVLTEDDVEEFAAALDSVIASAQRLPKAMVRFALQAARAGRAA